LEQQEIIIRKATIADIPTLIEFEQGVVEVERNFDSDLKDGQIKYYDINKLINDTDSQLIVATCGNELIGSGYAQIRKSKPYIQYQSYLYLGFIWVEPMYRGNRVSMTIIEALKTWGKSKGIFNVKLEVYAKNETAINAYRRCGFSECVVEMTIDLKK